MIIAGSDVHKLQCMNTQKESNPTRRNYWDQSMMSSLRGLRMRPSVKHLKNYHIKDLNLESTHSYRKKRNCPSPSRMK